MMQDIIGKRIKLQQEKIYELEEELRNKNRVNHPYYLLGLLSGSRVLLAELIRLYIIAGEGELTEKECNLKGHTDPVTKEVIREKIIKGGFSNDRSR